LIDILQGHGSHQVIFNAAECSSHGDDPNIPNGTQHFTSVLKHKLLSGREQNRAARNSNQQTGRQEKSPTEVFLAQLDPIGGTQRQGVW
jgi:hypothetical protein